MTREELEKAIKNGESVWTIYKGQSNAYEIKSNNIEKVLNDTFLWGKEYYANIKDVYKTKAEAEHYLHHANITRTETLPFLTWEEFVEEYSFDFYSENHEWFTMYWNDADGIVLENIISIDDKKTWDLTEDNFYKAYDECVRLFRSEE